MRYECNGASLNESATYPKVQRPRSSIPITRGRANSDTNAHAGASRSWQLRSPATATGAAVLVSERARVKSCADSAMQEGHPDFSLAEAVKMHILQTLTYCKGNRTRAAKRLGISIRCLRDKLRHYSESGVEIPAHPPRLPPIFARGVEGRSQTGMGE